MDWGSGWIKCILGGLGKMHRSYRIQNAQITMDGWSGYFDRSTFFPHGQKCIQRILVQCDKNILRIYRNYFENHCPSCILEYWFSTIRILRTHFNEDILKTFKTHWEYFSSQGRKCILRILVQCDKTELPPVCFSISFEGSVSTIQ